MAYDIQLQRVDSIPLAVVKRRASLAQLPTVIPPACRAVWNFVKAHQIPGAGRHIALYWDDEFNLEVGVELEAPLTIEGDVVASETPAGSVAMAEHIGPYQRLVEAHEAIRQWCADNGHAFAGPNWELYDHWRQEWNDNPAQIRTEVYYLLNEVSTAT